MVLLLIIIAIATFALISNFFKNQRIFIIISILSVLFFYFYLDKNFFRIESFYPTSEYKTYYFCTNFYNLVVDALKDKKLYIATIEDYPKLNNIDNIYKDFGKVHREIKEYKNLLDTSYYKGKLYLYFGLTPVLLFYLPFNLITNLYLTDKFIALILACLSFLLSLLLLKKLTTSLNFNIQKPIVILSIFIIGLCNYLPFFLLRSSIYEVAILTANVLLLFSLLFLYFYLQTTETNKQYFFLLLISVCLSLSVGARPFYVLHIPLFFILILLFKYNQDKNSKTILKTSFIFIIPCILYGTILALYNYLRFDSIFEFGFKYTLNFENHCEQIPTLKDSLLSIKYCLFKLPDLSDTTPFSLAQSFGHLFGNEAIIGILWSFPLVLSFAFLPRFLSNTAKKNKHVFYIIILMLSVAIINLFITSFIGMIMRYIFEYMSLIVIISLILFYYLCNNEKYKFLKNTLNIYFVLLFIYSSFMVVSCLFCEKYSFYYVKTSADNYSHLINFLFG